MALIVPWRLCLVRRDMLPRKSYSMLCDYWHWSDTVSQRASSYALGVSHAVRISARSCSHLSNTAFSEGDQKIRKRISATVIILHLLFPPHRRSNHAMQLTPGRCTI